MRCEDEDPSGVISETCLCGGEAKFLRWDGNTPILKCGRCGDTFEAIEESWLDDDEE